MITRRSVLTAGLLAAHRLSAGQPASTNRRVGVLSVASEPSTARPFAAFKQGMHDLGWLEGKNIEYRFAYANGFIDRLDALASELIGQKAEVIVTGSVPSARAAQRATKSIPIVMAGVGNPVGIGLVASLAKPGGNITGIASQNEDVFGKLIGILHEVAPSARRVAVLLNESSPNHDVIWTVAQNACTALGLVALRVVASTPAQLGAAIADIDRLRSQAIVVVSDPMFYAERTKLQEMLQVTRLPAAYGLREHVVAGGLLSYASDLSPAFSNAAKYVDKILKGAKPADLPVEQSNKFELVINLKTAKALGITIPKEILLRADEVIQ